MLKILAAAALLMSTTAAISGQYDAPSDGAIINDTNQDASVNCNGGPAIIDGSNNDIVFEGTCSSLTITGTNNDVSVLLAPNAFVEINGSNNTVKSDTAVRFSGAKNLDIDGANNDISISLAAAAIVGVAGSNNDVTWRSNARKLPRVNVSGANNSIKRVR